MTSRHALLRQSLISEPDSGPLEKLKKVEEVFV
jgi:hypothetical protein